jgi:hypothetical protein
MRKCSIYKGFLYEFMKKLKYLGRFPNFMKKKVLFLVLLLVLFSSLTLAVDSVESDHTDLSSTILPHEEAIFSLKVINNQAIEDKFRISKPFVYWSWLMDSEEIKVFSENDVWTTIKFKPFLEKEPGEYGVLVNVISLNDDSIRTEEFFEIKVVSYEQVLRYDINLPDEINPNKEQLFRIKIINDYDISIGDLDFVLFSDYFDERKNFSLGPFETVSLEIPVEFKGTVKEGENDLAFRFFKNDDLILEKKEIMNIGYFTDVARKGSPEDSFLYEKKTVVRTNTGNIVSHEVYTERLNWFEKFFTSTSPDPDVVSDSDGYYLMTWNFDLQPDETKTIIVETSYRTFVSVLILAILLFGFLYYWFRRDIVLEKKVVSMRKGEHGVYSMNIVLSLKNKTLKNIRNLKIMDQLGGRIEEISNFSVHKPSVHKSDSGKSAKLVWIIPKLGKREEVLLQYTMRYKPYTIRSVPSAVAKYLRQGRPVYVRSKRVDIF